MREPDALDAKIEYRSRPLFQDEAAQLIEKACPNLNQGDLTEPLAQEKIKLDLEAKDACRLNSLCIQVAKLELDKARFRSDDLIGERRQIESFNDEVDQE